jgi:hypothetical protein
MKTFLFTFILFLPARIIAQQSPELGIDRPGLSSQNTDARQAALQNIRALGATWFRDCPNSGSDANTVRFVEEVRQAGAQGCTS